MKNTNYREEHDSLGTVKVPKNAYYGAQTQRAVINFPISNLHLQRCFIKAQGLIKTAAAITNISLGKLDKKMGHAIVQAAKEVRDGKWDNQFVIAIYQAGAGTSQNMNANEVIANRALELLHRKKGDYTYIHPNDHVNMSQSTNDTIHSAIHIAAFESTDALLKELEKLEKALGKKAVEFKEIFKSGRTHLQDAVPITLGQEFSGYATMIHDNRKWIAQTAVRLQELNLGGTAVGTGLNASNAYTKQVIKELNTLSGMHFKSAKNKFALTQNMDAIVALSGTLKVLSVSLIKIVNDLRLLSSGPNAGFAEISLPPVQPGSSIMPGKVNPVMAEMINMVAYQVVGIDTTITEAGQAAQLELNVMTPIMGYNILHALEILTQSIHVFTKKCVTGIKANKKQCEENLQKNPIIATALTPYIGYEKVAEVIKEAYQRQMSIRSIVLEKGLLSATVLDKVLNPKKMV